MGCVDSKVAELLGQMGWDRRPEMAVDMQNDALTEYLENYKLEVVLPRHAPQLDISIGDRKQAMYPRPAFIHEGYKMHLAFIGPSTACKRQFVDFLPKMAHVFQAPPVKIAPGRDAVPHYFLDPTLHGMVLWELPEITFKQSAENYIRELGMMYIDCVFILFSDKYLLSEVYCKIIVAMAIHGIPFFVICTPSSDDVTEQEMQRIKAQFQQKDIQGIRIFNPSQPHDFLQNLIHDFFKEVSWNRGAGPNNKEVTKDCSDDVLGQTVRLKGLEKRPELNGRCGCCIGYDANTDRYLARLTADGVETDISLKASSFSVLKPKLLDQIVRIHGLVSKPELNGRYGYVDAFLRESERYRVFIPDRPNKAFSIALKSDNLEKVLDTKGAKPITEEATPKALPARAKTPAKQAQATSTTAKAAPVAAPKAASKAFDQPAREKPGVDRPAKDKPTASAKSAEPSPFPLGTRVQVHGTSREDLNGLFAKVMLYDAASGRVEVSLFGGKTLRFKPANLREVSGKAAASEEQASEEDSRTKAAEAAADRTVPADDRAMDASLAEDLPELFGERERKQPESKPEAEKKPPDDQNKPAGVYTGDDLMSRIFAAEQSMQDDDGEEEPRRKTWLEAEEEAVAEAQAAEAWAADGAAAEEQTVASSSMPASDEASPAAASPEAESAPASASPAHRRRLQLSLKGLLAMRVWAVVGDPDEAEELIDHLMDCGKTVFSVSSSSGAHFTSTAELNSNPGLPKAEVLAFVEPMEVDEVKAGAEDAARLGLRGVLLHPEAAAFSTDAMDLCRDAGLTVHAADILSEVQPGAGVAVAPLD